MPASQLRFAFDLGTHSIGWAVFRLDASSSASRSPVALIASGVRIFDDSRDPQKQKPLGEQRRGPRAARRRRDRFLQRRARVMALLIDFGLLPPDPVKRKSLAELDPYRFRAEALDRRLEPHEIGRALVHLNQRRGFKSNRKAGGKDAREEQGKIADAALKLKEKMEAAGVRTFGAFLWKRHGGADGKATPRTRDAVRIRLEGEGREALYEFYPTRAMLEAEFDEIMRVQAQHHSTVLSADRIALLRREMYFQRPLKTPPRGLCTFVDGETRLPRALPSVEARVAYEIVNHLRYGSGLKLAIPLTAEQRDVLVSELLKGKNLTARTLRKVTGAEADARFSKDDFKDVIAESAKKLASDGCFGKSWHDLSLADKDEVVARVMSDEDDDAVIEWLTARHGLEAAAAQAVASVSLKPGTTNLGPTANAAVLAELMRDDVPTYAEAVVRAGDARGEAWHHSDLDDPEALDELPYYAKVLAR
ncbi:MAG: type II CRISPR RNA-guided endonuclease Cas9, partial [Pseudomonadota bacterium]